MPRDSIWPMRCRRILSRWMRSSLLSQPQILRASAGVPDERLQTKVSERCSRHFQIPRRCDKGQLDGQRKASGVQQQCATSHNGSRYRGHVDGKHALCLVRQNLSDHDIQSGSGCGDGVYHDERRQGRNRFRIRWYGYRARSNQLLLPGCDQL